jgi:PIN domain nuclease of toxin-antitoxin system
VIVLDTHAAIWLVADDPSLGKRSRSLIADACAADELAISAISFWEIAMLIARGRLRALDGAEAMRARIAASAVREISLTGEIAVAAVGLRNLHADPADRFIVATAIAHDAVLLTADVKLLDWRHSLKRQNAGK